MGRGRVGNAYVHETAVVPLVQAGPGGPCIVRRLEGGRRLEQDLREIAGCPRECRIDPAVVERAPGDARDRSRATVAHEEVGRPLVHVLWVEALGRSP